MWFLNNIFPHQGHMVKVDVVKIRVTLVIMWRLLTQTLNITLSQSYDSDIVNK